MRKQCLFFLFFVVCLQISVSAQQKTMEGLNWQIFLDDSLIISGNSNTNNVSRPVAVIDIDNGSLLKNITIINKSNGAYRAWVEFREQDFILFQVNRYFAERPLNDTLIIKKEYYSDEFKSIKGKTIRIYYSDDRLQQTPTLLGTLIVKKD